MSSLASLLGFSRQYDLPFYVTEAQFQQLSFYFEPEQLKVAVLEREVPGYTR